MVSYHVTAASRMLSSIMRCTSSQWATFALLLLSTLCIQRNCICLLISMSQHFMWTPVTLSQYCWCTSQGFSLRCQRQPAAPAGCCSLVVYYDTDGTLADKSLPIKPGFGVPAKQLPQRPAWEMVEHDRTEWMLNRTEALWRVTIRPMLYFDGGASCNVVLTPHISGVRLPDTWQNSTAVCELRLSPRDW
mgnify:CR=1 FL=1